MSKKLVTVLLVLSMAALTSLWAQTPYPTQWQVNGNGYVGILTYTVDPNTFQVRGTLLGTPCEGVLVGRRLILHRTPRGSQIWEGWIMEPRLGAPGQPYYKGQYFIAGTISENNAGNSLYPWYGVPLGSGPPPWKTGAGGGQPGFTGGGQPGTTGGGTGSFTGPGAGGYTGGGTGGFTGGGQPGYTGGGQPGVTGSGTGSPTGRNLVVNGSFEQGPPVGDYRTFGTNSRDLPGWTVTKGTIDVTGSVVRAYDGKRAVDLAGTPGAGGIRQVLHTVPGQTYRLSFDMSGNPGRLPQCPDRVKTLTVKIGSIVKTYHFDTKNGTGNNPGWVRRVITFRTDSAQTPLEFLDPRDPNAGNECGPMVDNVIVFRFSGGAPPVTGAAGAGYALPPAAWKAHQNGAVHCSVSGDQLCIDSMASGGAYFTTRRRYAVDHPYAVSFEVKLRERNNHMITLYSDGYIYVDIDWGTELGHGQPGAPYNLRQEGGNLEPGRWYAIKVVAHPGQHSFDVFLNGKKVGTATNVSFPISHHLLLKPEGVTREIVYFGDADNPSLRGGAYNRGAACWRNIRYYVPGVNGRLALATAGEAVSAGNAATGLPGELLSSPANNPQAYLPGGEGMFDFHGVVDDLTFLHIRGDRVYAESPKGRQVVLGEFHFTQPLPAARLASLTLQKVKGRGKVEIWERPSAANNYALTLRIEDPKGGDGPYHLQVLWTR